MDYNTQRTKMPLPEYGRNIQKMVDYIKTVDDRDRRNVLARALIHIMGNLNPHLRDVADFKHKLWDHLAMMANFDLDIDYPIDITPPKILSEKPGKIPYLTGDVVFKHYGRNMEKFILAASNMAEGEEKEALIRLIANHMKKSYLIWNKEAVDDSIIINDLTRISGDKVVIKEDMKLNETRDILSRNKKPKRIPKKK
ncbi:MAG: DUF4290 domain-containing protein [Bacteroidota bacterium]